MKPQTRGRVLHPLLLAALLPLVPINVECAAGGNLLSRFINTDESKFNKAGNNATQMLFLRFAPFFSSFYCEVSEM